jgi:hypothetical protein
MELVLNLVWLLLVLFSLWNCLYVSRSIGDPRRPDLFRSLLLIVCLLALLFPAMSVSDDLYDLRMDTEEVNVSVGNGESDAGYPSPAFGKTIPLFAEFAAHVLIRSHIDPRYGVSNSDFVLLELLCAPERPSRAPPYDKSLVFVGSSTAQLVDLDLFLQCPSAIHRVMGLQFNFLHASAAGVNNRSSEWAMLLAKTREYPHRSVWKRTESFQQTVSAKKK